MSLKEDPKLIIRDLFRDNWDTDNTGGIRPDIHTGWFGSDSNDPQVTITGAEENSTQGGETGYVSLAGSSSAPAQLFLGSVNVNHWAKRDLNIGDNNPKEISYLFSEETKRIIRENFDSRTDIFNFSWQGRSEIVETETSPPVFRYRSVVGYIYMET